MTENKRFIVIDVPYENGEPFLYKKMLDKTTKKEYDNTLKGIDDMCDLANKLHKEKEDKQSHITHLENKIHRMRDNIKRLEGLYHYRGWEGTGDVKKECYQFKKEYTQLKKENQKLKNELKIADDNTGILQSENERLKSTLRDCCEKRRINDDEAIEWLRNNMVWEQMPTGKRTKTVIKTESHY